MLFVLVCTVNISGFLVHFLLKSIQTYSSTLHCKTICFFFNTYIIVMSLTFAFATLCLLCLSTILRWTGADGRFGIVPKPWGSHRPDAWRPSCRSFARDAGKPALLYLPRAISFLMSSNACLPCPLESKASLSSDLSCCLIIKLSTNHGIQPSLAHAT